MMLLILKQAKTSHNEKQRKVLAGKTLEKDFDPSIGCSIKWKI